MTFCEGSFPPSVSNSGSTVVLSVVCSSVIQEQTINTHRVGESPNLMTAPCEYSPGPPPKSPGLCHDRDQPLDSWMVSLRMWVMDSHLGSVCSSSSVGLIVSLINKVTFQISLLWRI